MHGGYMTIDAFVRMYINEEEDEVVNEKPLKHSETAKNVIGSLM